MNPQTRPRILTIGHSNHPWDLFLDLLRAHSVELLVDVRSHPYSRFNPHFNRARLESALVSAGIAYRYLGDLLGGKPDDPEFYDPDGCVLYGRLSRTPQFLHGVDQLIAEARRRRVAIMCAEEDPSGCHRRLLITPVLLDHGCNIAHIRRDHSVVTEGELRRSEDSSSDQLSLFQPDNPDWKSARPIRPPKK